MDFLETTIPGLRVAVLSAHEDERGSFLRTYCREEMLQAGVDLPVAQINHSRTTSVGAIRGMHFQRAPHAETKMVRCIAGEVYDVAIDLRRGSLTFLNWYGEVLTAQNRKMMIIPEGFAHGFQVLRAQSELLYLHTAAYAPHAEGGVAFDEPRLSIEWPVDVTDLSDRDRRHPHLGPGYQGLQI